MGGMRAERANETWVAASTAADIAAFTDMNGEVAAGAREREVSGIHFSSVAASSFEVRAINAAGDIIVIYPPSAQPANVAAGWVIDTDILMVPIPAGFRLQWRSATGGATAREVAVRVVPRQYGGPGA